MSIYLSQDGRPVHTCLHRSLQGGVCGQDSKHLCDGHCSRIRYALQCLLVDIVRSACQWGHRLGSLCTTLCLLRSCLNRSTYIYVCNSISLEHVKIVYRTKSMLRYTIPCFGMINCTIYYAILYYIILWYSIVVFDIQDKNSMCLCTCVWAVPWSSVWVAGMSASSRVRIPRVAPP